MSRRNCSSNISEIICRLEREVCSFFNRRRRNDSCCECEKEKSCKRHKCTCEIECACEDVCEKCCDLCDDKRC